MIRNILTIIFLSVLFVSAIDAKSRKPKEFKHPVIINTEVAKEHQRLYMSASRVEENIELPTLPNFPLDKPYYSKYVWGQQRTLKDLLK